MAYGKVERTTKKVVKDMGKQAKPGRSRKGLAGLKPMKKASGRGR